MSFLNPAALWLLLLIPLVFLARRRPARQRVPVANLYLWRVATPSGTSALTRRFRRHRLFLLQALVLVALILAVARPLLSLGTRSVVIIDVSLSMAASEGPQTRLDVAKAQAASFIDGLPWNADVRIIAAASTPRNLGEFRASDPGLGRALRAIQQSLESSDLAAAMQLARSVGPTPDRIAVFSDLASPIPPAAPSEVSWSVIGKPVDNVALTALGVLRRTGSAYASVAVTNYGGSEVTRTVVLDQRGRTMAREDLRIGPGRTRTVNAVAGLIGTITARIDGVDVLPEDNRRGAVVPPMRRVRVRLTGGAFFLEQALRAHPDVEVTVGPSAGADASAGADDVIVCVTCAELPAGSANVLMIPPAGDSLSPAAMTPSEIDHPLLDGIGLSDVSITPVAVRRDVSDATVIATAGDLPAIVTYASGARRVVEWRFDVSNGSVPLSPAFPLLVANAIDWLTRHQQDSSAREAGDPERGFVNPETANESDLRVTRIASVPTGFGGGPETDGGFGDRGEITALLLILALGALVMEWRHRRTAVV